MRGYKACSLAGEGGAREGPSRRCSMLMKYNIYAGSELFRNTKWDRFMIIITSQPIFLKIIC